jgi:putative ABC transport system permease protein
MYKNPGECIVSVDFAELNGIKLGDKIQVKSIITMVDGVPLDEILTMTVAGIYYDLTDEYNSPMLASIRPPGENRRNEIFTSYETLREATHVTRGYEVTASYYLKNPELLSEFEADLRAMGLSLDYMVTMNETSYQQIVAPVEGIRSISITFLIVVLVLGALILILLSSITIRERKYEIGVLRAMGMKKNKVATGLLCEMIALTVICLTLGLGIGAISSQPVADILLQQQIEAAESSNTNTNNSPGTGGGMVMIGGSNVSNNTPTLSEIDINLSGVAVAQIIGISLFLAVIASIVGIINITKYEPIKILMERN